MSIETGSPAPLFSLVSLGPDGPEVVDLGHEIGQSNIVLLFFPMAFTSVCTAEFCDLTAGMKEYEDLDATVFGISGDNPFAQQAWADKEGIKVRLLSDYEHAAAKAYGVAYDSFLPEKNLTMGGVAKRSAFLIDKEGVVRFADVKESPGDLPDFDALKKVLRELS